MRQWIGSAVLLALLVGSGSALAENAVILKTTEAGQPVKIRNHVKLSSGCGGGAPEIDFTPNPAHGTISIRPDRFMLTKGWVSGTLMECEGRDVDGVAIWYTPQPGFHGVEQLAWTVSYGGGSRSHRIDTFTAKVTVR
jgi:hypothetical protein